MITTDHLAAAVSDRYRLERELGRGGMATVYLAEDLRHHRAVALKVVHPHLAALMGRERFLREIAISARLSHPNLVPLYDSGSAGDLLYYVMPYVEGETLRQRLDRETQLPLEDVTQFVKELADALDYAHAQGVIHRDIKPANILIARGHAQLADFGIAMAVNVAGGERMTNTGVSLGTPEYMSPEQASGASLDLRADVYSLACVAFEMLMGEPPFTGPNAAAVIAKHLVELVPGMCLARPSIPESLESTVRRALSKVPADRFPSAGAFADALKLAASQRPDDRFRRKPAARRWPVALLSAAGALAVIASLVLGIEWVRSGSSQPVMRSTHQITFDGSIDVGVMSPDGELLAYTTQSGPWYRLSVMELRTGSILPVDSLDALLCCPTWAPDGSRLAYRRGTRSEGATVIAPRLGGSRRAVSADVATAWSDDGGRLLSWWPAAHTLKITDVATGDSIGQIALGNAHNWLHGADWSPDGKRIIVALLDSTGKGMLQTIGVNGSGRQRVIGDSMAIMSPVWGRNAVYYLMGDSLWAVSIGRNGEPRGAPWVVAAGLSAYLFNSTIPSLSLADDERTLFYTRFGGYSNLYHFETRAGRVLEPRALTRGTATRSYVRLSPNAQRIAYVESVGPTSNLFVAPLAAGNPQQLTSGSAAVYAVAWSPDGTRIAFTTSGNAAPGLWLVNLGSGASRRVSSEHFNGDEILWSERHGIVFQSADHREIRAISPETGAEMPLLPAAPDTWWYDLRLSPDERRLAMRRTGSIDGLWVLNLDTRQVEAVSREVFAPVHWSADGRSIYVIRTDGRSSAAREIFAQSAAGGSPRLAFTLPPEHAAAALNVSMSRDARTIVAALFFSTRDVWAISLARARR